MEFKVHKFHAEIRQFQFVNYTIKTSEATIVNAEGKLETKAEAKATMVHEKQQTDKSFTK